MAANEPSTGVKMVKVPEDRDGQRLDNFLLLQFKGAPRSLIYKLVRSGQVRINGKRAKPDSRLAGGDEVRLPPVKLNEAGESRPVPKGLLDRLAASIVFEDKALLDLRAEGAACLLVTHSAAAASVAEPANRSLPGRIRHGRGEHAAP